MKYIHFYKRNKEEKMKTGKRKKEKKKKENGNMNATIAETYYCIAAHVLRDAGESDLGLAMGEK